MIVPLLRRAAVALAALAFVAAAEPPPVPAVVEVRLDMVDAAARPVVGRLAAITPEAVALAGGDDPQVPIASIRRLETVGAAAAQRPPAVVIRLIDGGTLAGDTFTAASDTGRLGLGVAGSVVLPLDLVQIVCWPREGEDGAAPGWLSAVPDRPVGDVVVIRREDATECVECAIVAVAEKTVTVLLDGERIPVPRDRVAGLRWLRPAAQAAAGGARIDVLGGSLVASDVAWSPERLVLDGRITLPAAALRGIDFAAGRTVRLVDLTPESTTVAPFFAGAAVVDEVRQFFAPRFVAAAGTAEPVLLLRPRTVVVWRIPADSRRFRTILHQDTNRPRRAIVTLALDDREVFRHGPPDFARNAAESGAGSDTVPVDVDVTGARRLTITVDFAGGAGSPVQLAHPAFEK